ncbi:integrase core domain-containing protein [Celeribacter persicus]|uniref:integrase core domain-containing protein n=1 Tax=Celeribacter persicus TaxID=1651082 RepID=UPI003CCC160A
MREWAYGAAYTTSAARNRDLPRWLDWFNEKRPHSALKGQAPAQTLNNLPRFHT